MAKKAPLKKRKNALCVLVVDDQLEQAQAAALQFSGLAEARARTPDDVMEADLQAAQVILVDYELTHWKIDDSRSIAEHPKDGVALSAVLRSHITSDERIVIALHSGKLHGLSGGLTVECHLHSIARLN